MLEALYVSHGRWHANDKACVIPSDLKVHELEKKELRTSFRVWPHVVAEIFNFFPIVLQEKQ